MIYYCNHVADVIAMMSELGTGMDALSYEMEDSAIEFLDLQNEDMNKVMGQMVAPVQKTMQELANE